MFKQTTEKQNFVTITNLTEGIRIASPIQTNSDIISVIDAKGGVQLFTIGSDNCIWNFYPDENSDTGWNRISTGLRGTAMAATLHQGTIIVLAGDGCSLSSVGEDLLNPNRWGQIRKTTLSIEISEITCASNDTTLNTLVFSQIHNDNGRLCQSVLEWNDYVNGSPESSHLLEPHLACSKRKTPYMNAAGVIGFLICVNGETENRKNPEAGNIFGCIESDPDHADFPFTTDLSILSCDSVAVKSSESLVFAIGSDNNLFQLSPTKSQTSWSWKPLSKNGNFTQVQATMDQHGTVHVLCLSNDDKLFHWKSTYESPIQILEGVSAICIAKTNNSHVNTFLKRTGDTTLSHLYLEIESSNWVETKFETQAGGELELISEYSSQISIYDDAGAPMCSELVQLGTSEQACLHINGLTYYTNSRSPISIKTNKLGQLIIAQETKSLAVAAFELFVPRLDRFKIISQTSDIKERLSSKRASDIMTAQATKSGYLLKGDYRTDENAEHLALACKGCMDLFPSRLSDPGLKHNVRQRMSHPNNYWHIAIIDHKINYSKMTATESSDFLLNLHSSHHSANGTFGWLEDIGDFISAVKNKIIQVTDYIVSQVQGAIKASITFIINGARYIFDTVINIMEQAFDILESVWSNVCVYFNQLAEWLGSFFDWDEIRLTQDALAYSIRQVPDFLAGATQGIKQIVDVGFSNIHEDVKNAFSSITNAITTQNIGAFATSSKPNEGYSNGISNNFIFNSIIHASEILPHNNIQFLAPAQTTIDSIMSELGKFSDQVTNQPAFLRANEYFSSLGNSPDQIFSNTLAGLMSIIEGLIQIALSGIQLVIDALLTAIIELMHGLKAALDAPINIPFAKEFFAWLCPDKEFTLANLVGLMLAIPATATYKLITKSAPFVGADSVAQFKRNFSATSLLELSGLSPNPRVDHSIEPLKAFQLFVKITGNIAIMYYGAITAICDFLWVVTPAIVSVTAFVAESISQLLLCPWIYLPAPVTANQKYYWIWNWLGITIDFSYITLCGSLPEDTDGKGAVFASMFAAIQLTFGVIGCAESQSSKLALAGTIIYSIPGMGKILLIPGVVSATKGISLAACSLVDILCYGTSGIIGIIDAAMVYHSTNELNASDQAILIA